MDKLEKEIEAKFKACMERLGCIVLKFTSPGNAGVPDRLVILPGGRVLFAEIKKEGEKLRPLQEKWAERFDRMGVDFMVIDSEDAIERAKEVVCYRMPASNTDFDEDKREMMHFWK